MRTDRPLSLRRVVVLLSKKGKGRRCSGLPRSRISHVVRRSNQRFSSRLDRVFFFFRYAAPRARRASSGQGENEDRIIIMALWFFLLFVPYSLRPLCVCFLRQLRGLQLWGILFLFFCCWSHIESSSFLFRVIRWEIFLRLREIGQAGGYPRLIPYYISNKPLPWREQKLQDEYVLDSRIHSRPDPTRVFRNLQKDWRRGLGLIFEKIIRCWSGRSWGRSLGFCERDAQLMLFLKRKT